MRPRYAILTAATALVIGGFSFVPEVRAQNDPARGPGERAGQTVDDAANRTGDAIRRGAEGTVAAPDAEGIRDVLAQVAEASVTKNGLDDLVERFVDADRNRLGEGDALDENLDHLNGIIDQFRTNWKNKYNQDFDIEDEGTVFNESFASIIQGEIGDAARVAGERVPGAAPDAAPGAAPDVTPGPESDRVAGGDTNREPGRNVATVRIQESHGMPAVTVPMIQEAINSWKVDVPETLTAEQLRKNLEDCLTKLNEKQAEWPADVNEGYRHATHAILLAVTGQKDAMQHGGMEQDRQDTGMPGERPQQPAQPGEPGAPGTPR